MWMYKLKYGLMLVVLGYGHCSGIGWKDCHWPNARHPARQYQVETDQEERLWKVNWFVAESCKPIFNRYYVKSLSLLPITCLLSTKAGQNDLQSSPHPWWPGWYPEVWLTRSYSMLAQGFLKSSCFLLVIVQPVINVMKTDCISHPAVYWLWVDWP